jgi:hypothetical protein
MGEWGKLHYELDDLFSIPNIVRVVKSCKMGEAGRGEIR